MDPDVSTFSARVLGPACCSTALEAWRSCMLTLTFRVVDVARSEAPRAQMVVGVSACRKLPRCTVRSAQAFEIVLYLSRGRSAPTTRGAVRDSVAYECVVRRHSCQVFHREYRVTHALPVGRGAVGGHQEQLTREKAEASVGYVACRHQSTWLYH